MERLELDLLLGVLVLFLQTFVLDLALVLMNLLSLTQASIPELLSVLLCNLILLGRVWKMQLLTLALRLVRRVSEVLPLALREGWVLIFWPLLLLLLVDIGFLVIALLRRRMVLAALASGLA